MMPSLRGCSRVDKGCEISGEMRVEGGWQKDIEISNRDEELWATDEHGLPLTELLI
jgi:hypothetical protein